MYRATGKQVLATVITKEKNIELIEKYIFSKSYNEESYIHLLYESVGDLATQDEKKTNVIKNLITNLYKGNYNWNNPVYRSYIETEDEENQFVTNPIEIVEGVLECKCGSKKTISFQKQTRSADEGATTFAQCTVCGNKWKYNN